jgi:hypothetical protein
MLRCAQHDKSEFFHTFHAVTAKTCLKLIMHAPESRAKNYSIHCLILGSPSAFYFVVR